MRILIFLGFLVSFVFGSDFCERHWDVCKRARIEYELEKIKCLVDSDSQKEFEECKKEAKRKAVRLADELLKKKNPY